MTSTVTPTESSPARRWGRRTRAAASSMRATIRDVANTGGKAYAGSRLRALARSEGATVRCTEAVESTAGSLIAAGTIRRGCRPRSSLREQAAERFQPRKPQGLEQTAHARISQASSERGSPPHEGVQATLLRTHVVMHRRSWTTVVFIGSSSAPPRSEVKARRYGSSTRNRSAPSGRANRLPPREVKRLSIPIDDARRQKKRPLGLTRRQVPRSIAWKWDSSRAKWRTALLMTTSAA